MGLIETIVVFEFDIATITTTKNFRLIETIVVFEFVFFILIS